jgi:hypothetical protein
VDHCGTRLAFTGVYPAREYREFKQFTSRREKT